MPRVDFERFQVITDNGAYALEPIIEGVDPVTMDAYRVAKDGVPVGTIRYGATRHDVTPAGDVTAAELEAIATVWFDAVGSALEMAERELD